MEVAALPALSPDLDERERGCVEQVLHSAEIAHVAMVGPAERDDRPRPYVVPMNFVYEAPSDAGSGTGDAGSEGEGRLLLHTGPGRKVDALADNPRVCVSVISDERLELGSTPCEDGYLYQSVVLEGRAVLLTDDSERGASLRAIVAKYDPEAAHKPFDPRIFAQTLLYVVEVDQIGFKERPRHS